LWFDKAGEKTFGRKNFLELVSVFTSQPLLEVIYGRSSLAHLDQFTFSIDNGLAIQKGRPTILTLGGKHWIVTDIDWRRREVYVKPTEEGGKTRWSGSGQDIGKPFAQAELSILNGDAGSQRWSKRAITQMDSCRSTYSWLSTRRPTVRLRSDLSEWWTFSGTAMNRLIARHLDPTDEKTTFDHRRVLLQGRMTAEQASAIWKELVDAVRSGARYAPIESQLDLVKFSEAVPRHLLAEQTSQRLQPQDYSIEDSINIVSSGAG
jgi:ATP-dependent Lhr-like helicase